MRGKGDTKLSKKCCPLLVGWYTDNAGLCRRFGAHPPDFRAQPCVCISGNGTATPSRCYLSKLACCSVPGNLWNVGVYGGTLGDRGTLAQHDGPPGSLAPHVPATLGGGRTESLSPLSFRRGSLPCIHCLITPPCASSFPRFPTLGKALDVVQADRPPRIALPENACNSQGGYDNLRPSDRGGYGGRGGSRGKR